MKRTRTLSLVLMSASALSLTACDEPKEDVAVYESVEQCVRDGLHQEFCEQNYAAAVQEHLKAAPRYRSEEDCAADFGQDGCREYSTTGGSSLFLPLMAGYMMGNLTSGFGRNSSQPLYRSRDDGSAFRTADNARVGATTGRTQVARSVAAPPPARTTTSRRGGFGASATRYSGTSGFRSSFGG